MRWGTVLAVLLAAVQIGRAQLVILSPAGGETMFGGMTTVIRWTGTPPGTLHDVDFSIDGGATWLPIAAGVPGTSITWGPVPGLPTTTAHIRVIARAGAAQNSFVRLVDPAGLSDGPGYSASWSPDGKRVVTGSDSGYVTIYDAMTGAKLVQQRINNEDVPTQASLRVHRVQYDPAGAFIACYTNDDSVALCDPNTLAVTARWPTNIPSRPNFATDRGMDIHPTLPLIAISGDFITRVFDLAGNIVTEFRPFPISTNGFIQWHPDGDRLVVSGLSGLAVLQQSTASVLRVRSDGEHGGYFKISPNGQRVTAFGSAGTQPGRKWTIFDIDSLNPIDSFIPPTNFSGIALDYYPDGSLALERQPTGSTSIIEHRSGVDLSFIDTISTQYAYNDLQISPDPNYLVVEAFEGATVIGPRIAAVADTAVSNRFSITTTFSDSLITLAIDTVRTTTNSAIMPALRMLTRNDTAMGNANTMQVTISWNASMAVPINGIGPGTITGTRRSVTMTVPTRPVSDNILATVDMHTALGLDSATAITIDNVTGVRDPSRLKTIDGYLLLTDICRSGGSRFVNGNGTTQMRVHPNPSGGSSVAVEITTIEDGPVRILVSNSLGQQVYQRAQASLAGTQEFVLNTVLAPGTYNAVAVTPTMVLHTTILVLP
jgi:hypothetical protein